ncbi:MAG: hypothetical protein IH595_11310 [Bacteroidales bacterium]|nr:hypothetical protein [Bacteroidales bacterium]
MQRLSNVAAKTFTWDIIKTARGTLMFLDVPYKCKITKENEFLTLVVAKEPARQRPDFISILVPNNMVRAKGVSVMFSMNVKKDGIWTTESEKVKPIVVPFETCIKERCTARIVHGFATSDGKKVDVFKKFMSFDNVNFFFQYPGGSHEIVSLPLSSFKQQYGKLLGKNIGRGTSGVYHQ